VQKVLAGRRKDDGQRDLPHHAGKMAHVHKRMLLPTLDGPKGRRASIRQSNLISAPVEMHQHTG
jgi:hypothetical protein